MLYLSHEQWGKLVLRHTCGVFVNIFMPLKDKYTAKAYLAFLMNYSLMGIIT